MRAVRREQLVGSQPWLRAALRCGAILAMAALALPMAAQSAFAATEPPPAAGAPAVPGTGSDPLAATEATLGPLLDKIHLLYQNAEAATEQYNATAGLIATQQSSLDAINTKITQQQQVVDDGLDMAAQLASEQYRNGNLDAYAQLLLTKDPYQAVNDGEMLAAAGRSQAAFLSQLKTEQGTLDQLRSQAQSALTDSKTLLAQQDQSKTDIARQLATVEQLVSGLTGAQQTQLEQLEKTQADQAQLAFLASGALGQGERTPSAAGRAAVAYALAQLGKPYIWGAQGPDSFDCSGLTSQAWLHAGVPIPRVSEDQWADLQHVPLNQLRPGDLVLYYTGASHVALYIGGGLVVVAPHTGAVVRVSPIGASPILGAVRPDPNSPSDTQGGTWKVPDVLQNAQTLTPIAPSLPTVPGLPTVPPLSGLLPVLPVAPPAPTPVPSAPASPTPAGPGTPKPSGSASPSPSGSSTAPGTATGATPSAPASPSLSVSVPGTPAGGSPSASVSGTSPSPSRTSTAPSPNHS
ncbi:cell wall-associated NlpC family hydrolase [Kitasatospora sp. MAA4]|uniref:C40 family peptidase n=1 Tax=Kitasatospora sp. MAA4 TaxID=3035093 RepID=UPI002473135F|nr:C40 family peptidase [Kitasatospora sp. MAA4]MDH6133041.1 cell wall-associated NlpC family hydrolase [Kitasatospora sp. MAA4]